MKDKSVKLTWAQERDKLRLERKRMMQDTYWNKVIYRMKKRDAQK